MSFLTCPECNSERVHLVNDDSSAVYRCAECGTYFDESEIETADQPRYKRTKPRKWVEDDRF